MATSKKPAGGKKSAKKKKAASKKKVTSKKVASKRRPKSMALAPAGPVSFAAQIAPLFRAQDVQCMRGRGVLLLNYEWMSTKVDGQYTNANKVLGRLVPDAKGNRMPFGGPYWSKDNLDLFSKWIAGGCQP